MTSSLPTRARHVIERLKVLRALSLRLSSIASFFFFLNSEFYEKFENAKLNSLSLSSDSEKESEF